MVRGWPAALAALALGCAPAGVVREAARSDLEAARSMHGDDASRLHRAVFGDGPLDGRLYEAWFKARVAAVRPTGPFSGCGGAPVCQGVRRTVRIAPAFLDGRIPPVARLSLLLHEARHAESPRWGHRPCPSGRALKSPYLGLEVDGLPACDEETLGADGIQALMLGNVARHCRTCPQPMREEAARYAGFLKLLIPAAARAELDADLR